LGNFQSLLGFKMSKEFFPLDLGDNNNPIQAYNVEEFGNPPIFPEDFPNDVNPLDTQDDYSGTLSAGGDSFFPIEDNTSYFQNDPNTFDPSFDASFDPSYFPDDTADPLNSANDPNYNTADVFGGDTFSNVDSSQDLPWPDELSFFNDGSNQDYFNNPSSLHPANIHSHIDVSHATPSAAQSAQCLPPPPCH
jgi:hypothetical protein